MRTQPLSRAQLPKERRARPVNSEPWGPRYIVCAGGRLRRQIRQLVKERRAFWGVLGGWWGCRGGAYYEEPGWEEAGALGEVGGHFDILIEGKLRVLYERALDDVLRDDVGAMRGTCM